MISIDVNNNPEQVSINTSISELLKNLQQTENGIAVAINNAVVLKCNWKTTSLIENDKVLIIQATQGG